MTALDTLRHYWGYDSFRPLQQDIISSALDGHDTLALLPTGGGKSLTFQVPALMLPGLTIVVTPLISLMKDQVDNLRATGIRAYALHSGQTRQEQRLATDRCRLGKTKLLYVSPERLQSAAFMDELRTWDVSLIVVDEAHCISQWGYDFRPSYLRIRKLRELFPDVPVLALTASATPEVADDIRRQLDFRPDHNTFAKSFDRDNLSYVVRYDTYKERTLLRVLRATEGTAIVYVRSRRRCRELAEMLSAEGITASYYHAGLAPEDKDERQNLWKTDAVRVMVATNAFGMGIDKADVRLVVHIDLPSSLEEYYQEAGRAGRDGKPSWAVTIASDSDKGVLTRRLNDSFPPKDYILDIYEKTCVYLDIAVGGGYDEVYEFNYDDFCRRFGLQPSLVYSSLKLLTQARYIEYVDEVQSRARVMIIADKRELYSLDLDETADAVFTALQRQYTGLFADFTYINEEVIAQRAGATPQQVYDTLLLLSRKHIVSYVPRRRSPYIYFPTSREEKRYILLPVDVYARRRKVMEERIESMRRFVFDSSTCRSASMLRYFGEKDAQDCGRCDVCRARRKAQITRADAEALESEIRKLGDIPATEILMRYPESLRAEVIEAIRNINDK